MKRADAVFIVPHRWPCHKAAAYDLEINQIESMTATFRLFIVDGNWIAGNPDATFETVSGDAMHDSIDLEQASLEMVFEGRSDALRCLAHGEFGPEGGLTEWNGSDCYMGFISAFRTAEIAGLLAKTSPEELMQAATWIEDGFRAEIARCLRIFYPDLKQFIEGAAAQGNGLACLFTH